jgi:hypothetical protein
MLVSVVGEDAVVVAAAAVAAAAAVKDTELKHIVQCSLCHCDPSSPSAH